MQRKCIPLFPTPTTSQTLTHWCSAHYLCNSLLSLISIPPQNIVFLSFFAFDKIVWRCIIFLGWVLPFLGGCYFLSFSTIFLPGWKSLHLKSSLELCSPLKPLYGLVYCVRINSSRTITFHWDPHAGARKSTVTAQPSVTKTSSTLEHQIRSALEDD